METHFLQVCPSGQPPSVVQGHTIGFWLSGYLQYSLENGGGGVDTQICRYILLL